MTDIDDKLLEQQEQEQKEPNPELKVGGNGHDKEECETPIADEELKQYQEQEQPERREPNHDKEGPSNDNGKTQSAAEVLVELASGNAKLLFKDQYRTAHAEVQIGDHNEIIKVESSKFKRYLARLFYDKVKKKVVNAESIANAIQVLQAC